MNPIHLIGISGKQFSGKDETADILLDLLPHFRKTPIAGPIKDLYCQQHGINHIELEANKPAHRAGLIALGDWGRAIQPEYWLAQVLSQPGDKIISDVRLLREYDILKSMGAFLIRVETDRDIRAHRGKLVNEDDPTECQLDYVKDWDAVIANEGTLEELRKKLSAIFKR